ncbi:YdeI/OmpD-associated family protein [Lutimonas sp.]|uniref:YdeI/OmpD-associated family protein n=1 Tax=Lutimonas sp. TaxID=1872403 RepID=UPI003D9BF8A4
MSVDNQILSYIEQHDKFKDILLELRRIVTKHNFEETVKWGIPTYVFQHKNLVGIGAFKNHVGLWFFQGAFLKDSATILHNAQEGKTKGMRQIHFKELHEINESVLDAYLEETIANQKKGLEIAISKPSKKVSIPDELEVEFSADDTLKECFKKLTPGKQREYAEYISSAKRDQTKKVRLEKIRPMIIAGHGLNDKYKSNS